MYELIIIAKTEDAEGKVEKHLKDLAATDVKSQKTGKKQLAYPISKVTEAEYISWTFGAEGDAINQLNSKLRLEQEAVLRYLITKAPKAPKASKVSKAVAVEKVEEKAKPKVTVTTRVKSSQKENGIVKSAGKEKLAKVSKTTQGKKGKSK